jgi:CheY-like chemotaxis protein
MVATVSPSNFRVLIADDHPDSVESLAVLLNLDLGCQVLTAPDGRQAVQQALTHRPDVVILDLEMPFMSGIEAARQIRSISSSDPPLLLAVTGKGLSSSELALIDRQFDRAFAKPPDFDRLLAVLREYMSHTPVRNRSGGFDLSEVVTMAVREVGPLVNGKGLTFSFDYEGPSLLVEGDAALLQRSLRRVFSGAMAALDDGALIFSGEAMAQADGEVRLIISAAGTGQLAPPAELTRLLELMSLEESAGASARASGARTATGHCPDSGARIEYASLATEGVLFRAELSCRRSGHGPLVVDTPVDGARAWIIGVDDMPTSALQRRLQRLGWRATRFAHCDQALAVLDASPARPPELLIVLESADTTPAMLREFLAFAGPGCQRIFAVSGNSPILQAEQPVTGFEVRVYPLSPLELREFARQLSPPGNPSDPGPPTTSAGLADRPLVLIVDDNEVNHIVASGLLRALGYEVSTAHDGLDAISQCKRAPPNLVLMDIDMPVVNGLDATTRIRELQRLGRIAPFGIVAATANGATSSREDCLAVGMDGYVSKPLLLNTLREELSRVMERQPGAH